MKNNFNNKRNSKNEKEKLENSTIFNRVNKNIDAEVLKKKGIESPDIKENAYRFYDPDLRISYFFSNEEKYINFIKGREGNKRVEV